MESVHHQVQHDSTARQTNKFRDYFLWNEMVRLKFRSNLMHPLRINSAFGTLQSSNCYWSSPTKSFSISGPVGTHEILLFLQIFCVLKWGIPFDKSRVLLPVTPLLLRSDTAGSHSLTHSHPHSLAWQSLRYYIRLNTLRNRNNQSPKPQHCLISTTIINLIMSYPNNHHYLNMRDLNDY